MEVRPGAAPGQPEKAAAPAQPEKTAAAANEWREFLHNDDVPLCLFTTWDDWNKAKTLDEVKPSAQLRENHAINFGVFGSGCASKECVRDPTLQCWADVVGPIITVHARYSGFEKPGASCARDCEPVYAQCNTPLLGEGDYVIVYGGEQWNVHVPSERKPACLKR